VLNARKEMLDRTFEEVNSQISEMSSAEKARLYGAILEKGRKVINDPKIYCPIGEAKLLPVKNGEDVRRGQDGSGLILESKDGRYASIAPSRPSYKASGSGAEEHLQYPVRVKHGFDIWEEGELSIRLCKGSGQKEPSPHEGELSKAIDDGPERDRPFPGRDPV
jgi:hypothetical protein